MRYDYLLVDNDNTLMDFDLAEQLSLKDTLKAFSLPAEDDLCRIYHRENARMWALLEQGRITVPALKVERYRSFLACIGHEEIDPAAMAAYYEDKLAHHGELLPDAVPFLQALHGKMKIALLTNGIPQVQRGRFAGSPIIPLTDAVVISGEVGLAKPDPAIADLALKELGCTDRRRAVILGDSLTSDIACARNAGLDSIWLSPGGKQSDLPTYTVTSLQEALPLLTGE